MRKLNYTFTKMTKDEYWRMFGYIQNCRYLWYFSSLGQPTMVLHSSMFYTTVKLFSSDS